MTDQPAERAPNNSLAYRRARRRARHYLADPERLNELLFRARSKAAQRQDSARGQLWDDLRTLLRMLKAYARGDYRVIPWKSLLLITASVVYFVMPLDAIPDFIPLLGFFDDAALLAWTLGQVRSDVEQFVTWEKRPHSSPDQ